MSDSRRPNTGGMFELWPAMRPIFFERFLVSGSRLNSIKILPLRSKYLTWDLSILPKNLVSCPKSLVTLVIYWAKPRCSTSSRLIPVIPFSFQSSLSPKNTAPRRCHWCIRKRVGRDSGLRCRRAFRRELARTQPKISGTENAESQARTLTFGVPTLDR